MEGKETYKFAFCKPHDESGEVNIVTDPENLGEWLTGNDIQNSPYVLQMKTDSYCMQLCTSYLGRSKKGGVPSLIKDSYHHNWIVDNIPAAMMMEVSEEEVSKPIPPPRLALTPPPFHLHLTSTSPPPPPQLHSRTRKSSRPCT